MASIVTVLAVYNGRDAATWVFPYNITLNAIIASLNTLGKSLLIFALSAAIGQWKWITVNQKPLRLRTFGYIDRASRGPLGSVQLLWDMSISVVSIGAVLMILNLLSDPFIQQVIALRPLTSHSRESSVRIPKANNYTVCEGEEDPMFGAVLSVLGGNVNTGTSGLADCPTNDCQYDPFNTLALCSNCTDVTAELQVEPTFQVVNVSSGNSDTFNVTLNSTRFRFKDLVLENVNHDLMDTRYDSGLAKVWNFTISPFDEIEFEVPALTTVLFRSINVTDLQSVLSWPNTTVVAEECSLSFCIQNVHSSLRSGTLTESVQTQSATSTQQLPPGGTGSNSISTTACGGPRSIKIQDLSSPLEPYYLSTPSQQGISDIFYYNWLQSSPGPSSGHDVEPVGYVGLDGSGPNLTILNRSPLVGIRNAASSTMYYSQNISLVLSDIADVMTRTLRQETSGTRHTGGEALVHTTVINVRWPWLVVPLLNTVAGAIFLALTVVSTAKAKVAPWKEEILATLMHGIKSPAHVKAIGHLVTNASMENYAGHTNVRLHEPSSGSWGLATERSYVQAVQSANLPPARLRKNVRSRV
ncbi:MAG: hypothetical protein Q9227_008044 [Pyrenula ochraceoflavens]